MGSGGKKNLRLIAGRYRETGGRRFQPLSSVQKHDAFEGSNQEMRCGK